MAILTETVSNGVHDGKDEVEAVADVERDQDVVETVAHFSPIQTFKHRIFQFMKKKLMKTH